MGKAGQQNQAVRDAFSQTLGRARKQRNLSQGDLAYLTDMHRTEISALERGKREPRLQTLIKLSAALEIPINDFFIGVEWRPLVLAPASAGMGRFHVKQSEA
jgi:transcriptional regulator with XRE-family HTH domain